MGTEFNPEGKGCVEGGRLGLLTGPVPPTVTSIDGTSVSLVGAPWDKNASLKGSVLTRALRIWRALEGLNAKLSETLSPGEVIRISSYAWGISTNSKSIEHPISPEVRFDVKGWCLVATHGGLCVAAYDHQESGFATLTGALAKPHDVSGHFEIIGKANLLTCLRLATQTSAEKLAKDVAAIRKTSDVA